MRKLIVLAFVFLGMASFAQAQDDDSRPPFMLPNTETMIVTSPFNGQEYLVIVDLPISYNTLEKTYPVLYLTDPEFNLGTAHDIVSLMGGGPELPDIIIVNVGYPAYLRVGTDPGANKEFLELRSEDLRADRRPDLFLEFLRETLIPIIDTTYRTDPADNAIAGHSSGGDFALYALFHAPDTFSRFLASSPGSGPGGSGAVCVACEIENVTELTARLYISSGQGERATALYVEEAFTLLEEADYEGLNITKEIFEGQSHVSVVPFALSEGLRALFCDPINPAFCLYRPMPVSNE